MRAAGAGSGPETFDVAVVGGGIFGTAIAFYLAERRAGSVVLLDAGHVAGGATGWTSGIVRVHYTNLPEAKLAAVGCRVFRNWAAEIGGDCGFHRTGFLRIVAEIDRDNLRRNVEMLRGLGADVAFLEPSDVRGLQPYLSTDGIAGGAYEPDGGYASGTDTARAFAAAAAGRGAVVREGVAVQGLRVSGGRVRGVDTSGGTIAAERVVVAAGAWSFALLREAGVTLPHYTKLVRAGLLLHPPDMPAADAGYMTIIDDSNGTYFKPDRANRTEFALGYERDVAPSYGPFSVSQDVLAEGASHLVPRVPAFEKAGLMRGWGAVDGYSPDGSPVFGAAPGVEGLYVAVAGGGHGFKIAPAVGMGMADMLTGGGAGTVDLSPFRPTRFAEGAAVRSGDDYTRPNWRNRRH